MSMIGIHYHCIRHMTMFMNSSNFKLSTVILTQVVVADFPATVNLIFSWFLSSIPIHGRRLNIKIYRQTNRQAEKREKKVILSP